MAQTDYDLPEEESFVDDLEVEAPNSLMQSLRDKRKAMDDQKFFDLEIPAYDGLVKVRYAKQMTTAEVDKILRKVSKSKNPQDNLNASCDIIIRCTHTIWARMDDESKWVLLEDEEHGPYIWGSPILKFLGLPHSDTARGVVKTVFGNDLVIISTQGRVFKWLQGDLDENSGQEVTGE